MQFSTWSITKLAVVLGIAGLVLGGTGSFLIAPVYRSSATLKIDMPGGASDQEFLARIQGLVLSRSDLAGIINDPRLLLYKDLLKVTPLEEVIEKMRRDIRVETVRPGVFEVSFLYTDPLVALKTVDELAARFQEPASVIKLTMPYSAQGHGIEVIDYPSLPIRPLFPSTDLVASVGLLCGLGIAIAVWRYRRKRFATWGFGVTAVVLALVSVIASQVAFVLCVYGYHNEEGPNVFGAKFRSSAVLSVQNLTPQQVEAIKGEVLSRTSLDGVILDPRVQLYARQRESTPLDGVVQTMQDHLTVDYDSAGRYVTMAFAYTSRFKAQQAMLMLLNRFTAVSGQMYGDAATGPDRVWGTVSVLNPASTPILPVSPNRFDFTAEGGAAGLIMAALIALVRRRWQPEPELPLDAVSE